MSKILVYTLLGGDLNKGFPVVTAQLWHHDQFFKIIGSLPAAPKLNQLYQRWQRLHEAIHQRLGNNQRIKVYQEDITNVSVNDFDRICQQLRASLNDWLRFDSFANIERQLRTLLNRDDEVRVIIETNIVELHQLPWHLWDFFDDYPQAELGVSNHEYASPQVLRKSSTDKVKILAILGNKAGIDIDKDRLFLENVSNTETLFLVEPSRQQLDEQLWNHNWDILFFAGHSVSSRDKDIGEIYINQTESLTIYQLKNALNTAISKGLNIAIFNSCDGIGLARNLAELNIPQMIVMRTAVPDFVAQEFLKNFLIAFSNNKPFYPAVREARERLQGLENDFPCASWLPVIYQNPTTVPVTWQELYNNRSQTNLIDKPVQNKISFSKYQFFTFVFSIFIVALSTIGLRYFGFFEKIELQTFDQMLRLKPKEEIDPKVVVVEITEEDIQSRPELTLGAKSISDSTLAILLNKLQDYQPQVIGIDIYRDLPDRKNKSNQIKLSTELQKQNVIAACKGKDKKYDPQGIKPPQEVPPERQGFTDAIKDPDGIVRRQILMMKQEPTSSCETPYSLALQLASRYLFDRNIPLSFKNDYIKFGSKEFKRLKQGRSGAYQTVSLGGNQILINYRNTDSYFGVSLTDVLNDKVAPHQLKDKVVIIGVTANSISDNWSTPYSSNRKHYYDVPGVIIQAQKVSQILNAVLEDRAIIWVLPFWADIIWICGWSVVGSLMIVKISSLSHQGFAIAAKIVFLYGTCAVILLSSGLWVPFIPSAFGVVVGSVVVLFVQNSNSKSYKF